ncbi:mechanosensitive ion channel family protein [Pseudochryseolinea flava]|uniref:Mechanosensitive ion channel MscS domain-containing protein n=1 Tax=Pseudochryseolinea flava TaxID=2059302 RepID=A0A364Y1W8_9BACT|nr:mechanosensitive ion channel domain-containing protein [Pseudochryseolinea flava]RAW00657.1 hypothetical protein DQQ10_13795 [Pseudochryseolinea flava]
MKSKFSAFFVAFVLLPLLFNTHTALAQRQARGNAFSDSVDVSVGEYMLHVTSLFHKIDSIRTMARTNGQTRDTKANIAEIENVLQFVDGSLNRSSASFSLRNLQLLELILANAHAELKIENEKLNVSYQILSKLKTELISIRQDSITKRLIRDKGKLKSIYPQLAELKRNYSRTDSLVKVKLNTISAIKVSGASHEITATLLASDIRKEKRNATQRLFGNEKPSLWAAGSDTTDIKSEIESAYDTERKALHYYFKEFNGEIFFLLLFTTLFYFWIRQNLNRVKRAQQLDTLTGNGVFIIVNHPLLAIVAATLCLAPFFDLHAPASYIEILQFWLLVTMTILFYKQWPKNKFKEWIYVVVLYLLVISSSHLFPLAALQRYVMVVLNVLVIFLGLSFAKHIPDSFPMKRFTRFVMIVVVVLNVIAILLNIFGRVSLSQVFGTTAMFAFTNVIALSVLVQVLTEFITLQTQAQRIKHEIPGTITPATIYKSFRIPFLATAIMLWLIVFTTNLNIYDGVHRSLTKIFQYNISFGTNAISLGSIILFALIIMMAHFMQRNIGYFLGDIGEDDGDVSEQRSKLIMTRLILLICGYLLAIVVSGLPMDQITIIIGALGVGIGLGLQNIVNNFVSGVILIFDRPLRIGDTIDVGGKEGQIKEIGIRSSTLLTSDGAEVIIPNGDILSQQITNWTHSNPYKRINLTLKIMTTQEKDFVIDVIDNAIKDQEGILPTRPATIVLESVKTGEYNLKLFIWASNVSHSENLKSEVRYALFKAFKTLNIETL